ncbi:MAG: VWA domain-containing protein [Saprospiraceae bacterium]
MMGDWTQLTFAYPWALLLLLLAPAIVWWRLRTRNRHYPHLRMSNLQSIDGAPTWRVYLRRALPWLRALALVSIVIALARPRLALQQESIKAEGIDIVLTMDLSSSMLAQDFRPSRLEASKKVATDFVQKRHYDRIAVVAFAGEAFTSCPLTTDHDVVRTFLGALQCGALNDGTAIGQGLATAINRVKESKSASKVIILLTDGVNNAGYLSPEMAADIARQFGIRVYTIGVGSEGEALTPVSKDRFGRYRYDIAKVEIDEPLLTQIAEATDGRYFRATNQQELEEIYSLIDQLEKTEIETTIIRRYAEKFRLFVLIAACLLLLEVVLKYAVEGDSLNRKMCCFF